MRYDADAQAPEALITLGGVAERLNAPVLKTGIPFGVSRVRIPPPPLFSGPVIDSLTGDGAAFASTQGVVGISRIFAGEAFGLTIRPAHGDVRNYRLITQSHMIT